MTKWLAISAYRCEVAGSPTDFIDISVRCLDLPNLEDVEPALQAEPVVTYENENKEQVAWFLSNVIAIQEFAEKPDDDELIGFIATTAEIQAWAKPT